METDTPCLPFSSSPRHSVGDCSGIKETTSLFVLVEAGHPCDSCATLKEIICPISDIGVAFLTRGIIKTSTKGQPFRLFFSVLHHRPHHRHHHVVGLHRRQCVPHRPHGRCLHFGYLHTNDRVLSGYAQQQLASLRSSAAQDIYTQPRPGAGPRGSHSGGGGGVGARVRPGAGAGARAKVGAGPCSQHGGEMGRLSR